jgi:hypothetical protein
MKLLGSAVWIKIILTWAASCIWLQAPVTARAQTNAVPKVKVPAPTLNIIAYTNNVAVIGVVGEAGRSVTLRATVDFTTWVGLGTNVMPAVFLDTAGALRWRYYRAEIR